MNVVDSGGWLAYFANGANADFFAEPLVADAATLVVPAISTVDVFKRVLAQRGGVAALPAAALMPQEQVLPMDASLAMVAARLSHELKLPTADSIMLATARQADAVLWTQDAAFAGLPGVRYGGEGRCALRGCGRGPGVWEGQGAGRPGSGLKRQVVAVAQRGEWRGSGLESAGGA